MQLISPRDIKTRETKNKIYEATKTILQTYGFKYVTVRNVCEEAHVTQGAFYYHFDSKQSLLSEYGREVFLDMRLANPLPGKIERYDFIKVISWYLHVYCIYCEKMGQEFMKHHFDNCKKDIFYETSFSDCIIEPIRQAIDTRYFFFPAERGNEYLSCLNEDLETLYTGIVRCWSHQTLGETSTSSLDGLMYRIVIRFLYTFATDTYKNIYTLRNETSPSEDCYDFSKRFESFKKQR